MNLLERIKPIRSEEDYREALALIDELIDAEPASDAYRVLDVVSDLVHAYEERNIEIPLPSQVAAIQFRMDQLGLNRRDLEPIIGSSGKVSEVLSGKQPLTLKMMRALHKHLGIPAEVLLGVPHARLDEDGVAENADRYPIAEMGKLGWFAGFGDVQDRAEEAIRWLIARAGVAPNHIAAYCRKNDEARHNAKMDGFAFQAWCLHVLATASEQRLPAKFDRDAINDDFLRHVASLSTLENGPELVREVLAKKGIRFVYAPHLKKTYLDGAAMLLPDGTPVVALTIRYDRIDNFWHSLIHELVHVRYDLHEPGEIISDDLSIPSANSEIEKRADAESSEALVPENYLPPLEEREKMDVAELFAVAQKANVHPAVVAGRIRHDTGNWKKFARIVGSGSVRYQLEG
jgi:HTH-type transcriptional regulator/antitoxin HigA